MTRATCFQHDISSNALSSDSPPTTTHKGLCSRQCECECLCRKWARDIDTGMSLSYARNDGDSDLDVLLQRFKHRQHHVLLLYLMHVLQAGPNVL